MGDLGDFGDTLPLITNVSALSLEIFVTSASSSKVTFATIKQTSVMRQRQKRENKFELILSLVYLCCDFQSCHLHGAKLRHQCLLPLFKRNMLKFSPKSQDFDVFIAERACTLSTP